MYRYYGYVSTFTAGIKRYHYQKGKYSMIALFMFEEKKNSLRENPFCVAHLFPTPASQNITLSPNKRIAGTRL